MTLGGLALAVGILVDDGTVTIENINYHLEQGKADRARDPGRRAADRRFRPSSRCCASASCSCRCSSSAASPAICSGRWPRRWCSRWSARSCCRARSCRPWPIICMRGHSRACGHARTAHRTAAAHWRNPLKRFQRGFERSLRARARRATARCCRSRSAVPRPSSPASSPASSFRFGLWPFLGENFFPAVDSGQILMHVRAQPGTRIEETARLFDLDRADRSARSSRPISSTTSSTISACRSPASTWPTRTPARSARPTATP